MWSPATTQALANLILAACTEALVLRRGSSTRAAQLVALALTARVPTEQRSDGGQATTAAVQVVGAPSLDIQPGDRFTWHGRSCTVRFVRPDRTTATVAEALLEE